MKNRRYIWDLFGNIEHCISALIYISGNEIVCENEVGVIFGQCIIKIICLYSVFCVFGMTLASIDIKCIRK